MFIITIYVINYPTMHISKISKSVNFSKSETYQSLYILITWNIIICPSDFIRNVRWRMGGGGAREGGVSYCTHVQAHSISVLSLFLALSQTRGVEY